MERKMLAAALLLCTMAVGTKAQDADEVRSTKPIFISIDCGVIGFGSEYNDQPYVRSNGYDYYDGDASTCVSTTSVKKHAGLKAEFYLADKFSVATGVRYSQFYRKISGGNDFWDPHEFFYVAVASHNNITDYYRVEDIQQRVHCIGIPLELKFSPSRPSRHARFYLKLAGDINFRVDDEVEVDFRREEMGRYARDIKNTVSKPADMFASGYAGLGFEFGSQESTRFSFEFQFPSYVTSDSNSFLKSNVGFGIQFGLAFPVL